MNKALSSLSLPSRPLQPLHLLLLVTLALLLRFITLSAYPLLDPTEARYAEIAREMVAIDNWITPQLDPGKPFWAKPPLSIWATALCYRLLGVSELSARLSSFVFSVLSLFLTFLVASDLKGRTFSLLATLVLSTTGLFYFMLGGVMTDPSFLFAITLAMTSFLLSLRSRLTRSRLLWGHLFFLAIGLSILAKGPLGLMLIVLPIVLWTIRFRRWATVLSELPWLTGILLLLVTALPWHVLAELRTPGFLRYYLLGEHLERFLLSGWGGDLYGGAHPQPRGMIWLFLVPASLPWSIVFLGRLYRAFRRGLFPSVIKNEWMSYLLMWFLAPFVLFTLAGNILITYVLPGLPAFALLTVYSISVERNPGTASQSSWSIGPKSLIALGLMVPLLSTLAVFLILPEMGVEKSHKQVGEYFSRARKNDSARLIYTRPMPPSADFYAEGWALELEKQASTEEILRYMDDKIEDWYVIYEEDVPRLASHILSSLQKARDFGEYSIYRETEYLRHVHSE